MYLLWCNEEKVNVAIFPPIVGTPWCAPIKVKHGAVSCRTPRGEHYKNVMGTRCKIRCKQGYESESSEVVCMASKHWSSNYACRGENWHPSEHAHIVSPHTHVCINTHTHTFTFPHTCILGLTHGFLISSFLAQVHLPTWTNWEGFFLLCIFPTQI